MRSARRDLKSAEQHEEQECGKQRQNNKDCHAPLQAGHPVRRGSGESRDAGVHWIARLRGRRHLCVHAEPHLACSEQARPVCPFSAIAPAAGGAPISPVVEFMIARLRPLPARGRSPCRRETPCDKHRVSLPSRRSHAGNQPNRTRTIRLLDQERLLAAMRLPHPEARRAEISARHAGWNVIVWAQI